MLSVVICLEKSIPGGMKAVAESEEAAHCSILRRTESILADAFEDLMHYMCYLISRATKAVSIPHGLLCRPRVVRARCY
jgi:hypothetical protein